MNSSPTIETPAPIHPEKPESTAESMETVAQLFALHPKVTHITEFFKNAIEEEVEHFCANPLGLKPYVQHLSSSLLMNELELAAWMYVLKKALYGEAQERQLRALQYSAYLSKSLMSRDMSLFDAALNREDPQFLDSFRAWLKSHKRCSELTVRELHSQFKELWARGKQSGSRENLNTVVDGIVQAKTEVKNEEPQMILPEVPSQRNSFEASGSGLFGGSLLGLAPGLSLASGPPTSVSTSFFLEDSFSHSNPRLFNS